MTLDMYAYLLEISFILIEMEEWSGEDSIILPPGAHSRFPSSLVQLILTLEHPLPINTVKLKGSNGYNHSRFDLSHMSNFRVSNILVGTPHLNHRKAEV